MSEQIRWTKTVDERTYESYLREAEPGIYHVSAELFHQMMRDLGWVPDDDPESAS